MKQRIIIAICMLTYACGRRGDDSHPESAEISFSAAKPGSAAECSKAPPVTLAYNGKEGETLVVNQSAAGQEISFDVKVYKYLKVHGSNKDLLEACRKAMTQSQTIPWASELLGSEFDWRTKYTAAGTERRRALNSGKKLECADQFLACLAYCFDCSSKSGTRQVLHKAFDLGCSSPVPVPPNYPGSPKLPVSPTVSPVPTAVPQPIGTLHVSKIGGGVVHSYGSLIDCGPRCSHTGNGSIFVDAYPAESFIEWLGPCTGTGPCTAPGSCTGQTQCGVYLNGDVAVTARFAPTATPTSKPSSPPAATPMPSATPGSFMLSVTRGGTAAGTVVSNVGGINCGSTCNASFVSGETVILTAQPQMGSVFAGWGGACTGAGSCTILMNALKSAHAVFQDGASATPSPQGTPAPTPIPTPKPTVAPSPAPSPLPTPSPSPSTSPPTSLPSCTVTLDPWHTGQGGYVLAWLQLSSGLTAERWEILGAGKSNQWGQAPEPGRYYQYVQATHTLTGRVTAEVDTNQGVVKCSTIMSVGSSQPATQPTDLPSPPFACADVRAPGLVTENEIFYVGVRMSYNSIAPVNIDVNGTELATHFDAATQEYYAYMSFSGNSVNLRPTLVDQYGRRAAASGNCVERSVLVKTVTGEILPFPAAPSASSSPKLTVILHGTQSGMVRSIWNPDEIRCATGRGSKCSQTYSYVPGQLPSIVRLVTRKYSNSGCVNMTLSGSGCMDSQVGVCMLRMDRDQTVHAYFHQCTEDNGGENPSEDPPSSGY